jgi:hypothetical protein
VSETENELVYFNNSTNYTTTLLRQYATGRKVAGLSPVKVIDFFSNYLSLLAALGPGVYSASNRNEYKKQRKKILWSLVQPVHKADNLIAMCELIA